MTDKINPTELPISRDTAQKYRALRRTALQRIRAYDLSEAAFQAIFDNGLLPLEDFMRRAARDMGQSLTEKVETAFADAARSVVYTRTAPTTRYATIGDLLSVAHHRYERLRDDIFARLAKGGAQIQPVSGCLVLTDPMEHTLGTGEGGREYKPEFAPRSRELVFALLRMGIYADDLFIYRGTVLPNMMRQSPYALIDIPRLGKQIAVCDQIGEICFVSLEAKPLSFWSSSSKNALKADPAAIKPIEYDRAGKWLDKIRDILLGDGITNVSANRFPKIAVPRAQKKPLLTKETLCRWITIFREVEGRCPQGADKQPVYDRNTDETLSIVADEAWKAIDMAFTNKSRRVAGMDYDTLADFKRQNGFDILIREQLCRWHKIFKEIEHRYPAAGDDKPVWDRDAKGKPFIVAGKTWTAIDAAFVHKSRSVAGMNYTSLADFKRQNGFNEKTRPGPKPRAALTPATSSGDLQPS